MSLAVLGTMAGGCYIGFNGINTYAVSSRLYSEAQATAQNQIDLVLSRGPFNVTSAPNKVPIELMTAAELNALNPQPLSSPPPTSDPYYPYYRDATQANSPLAKQAFVYRDPVNNDVTVIGTLTTSISDVGSNITYGGLSANLNIRRATVNVRYSFRGYNYNVALETLRTADQ